MINFLAELVDEQANNFVHRKYAHILSSFSFSRVPKLFHCSLVTYIDCFNISNQVAKFIQPGCPKLALKKENLLYKNPSVGLSKTHASVLLTIIYLFYLFIYLEKTKAWLSLYCQAHQKSAVPDGWSRVCTYCAGWQEKNQKREGKKGKERKEPEKKQDISGIYILDQNSFLRLLSFK